MFLVSLVMKIKCGISNTYSRALLVWLESIKSYCTIAINMITSAIYFFNSICSFIWKPE